MKPTTNKFEQKSYSFGGKFTPSVSVEDDFSRSSPSSIQGVKNFTFRSFETNEKEVSFSRGQRFSRVGFSGSNYTSATNDYLISLTSLAIAPTIGLPHPSLVGIGKTFIVKDEVGGAGTTTITIRSDGERTIDGATSITISTNYGSKDFYTDGSNWFTK